MESLKYQFVKQYKYCYRLEMTSLCQVKLLTLTLKFDTRTGQELATTLVLVFLDQGTTIGRRSFGQRLYSFSS